MRLHIGGSGGGYLDWHARPVTSNPDSMMLSLAVFFVTTREPRIERYKSLDLKSEPFSEPLYNYIEEYTGYESLYLLDWI